MLLDPGLRALGRDRPRYRQLAGASGRLRFAVSRAVLKHTAAAALQVPTQTLDLAYRSADGPWLGEVEVSLAHTDELIVVGVSRTGPVGVDAEPVARVMSFELLAPASSCPEHACPVAEAGHGSSTTAVR
ncbi:4'-phosphopantetheinyl transferase family protein [Streptomyces sp. SD15]